MSTIDNYDYSQTPDASEYIDLFTGPTNPNNTVGVRSLEQYGLIYDLISEGEIEGLVNGPASIKFNGNPIYVDNPGTEGHDSYLYTYAAGEVLTGAYDQGLPTIVQGSIPSVSFLKEVGASLIWTNDTITPGRPNPPVESGAPVVLDPGTHLGLSPDQIKSLDLVKISLEFPNGLYRYNNKADMSDAIVEVQMYLILDPDTPEEQPPILIAGREFYSQWPTKAKTSPTAFEYNPGYQVSGYGGFDAESAYKSGPGTVGSIGGKTKGSFITDLYVPLQGRSFDNFKIEIRRPTPSHPRDYWNTAADDDSPRNFVGTCIVKYIEGQSLDKLNYAGSAYGAVTYSAKDFPNGPSRSYHVRGKKIKVPSNYLTREENSGEATYTGFWDGTLREAVYCNNPAWVYYDILTSNTYGLGSFIRPEEINIYELYQIAKYCDELVDDGEGGLEPRFTCNVYLQKGENSYKVLKDLASTFRGLTYWMDGLVTPVQDRPKEPLYTFTRGNVIDGMFNYQYTGDKARSNQVNVTWNNPSNSYRQTVLSVDDTDNIVDTGRIVSKDVVAFGCTSVGQASRVATWHLLTDTLETEVVSFSSSINSGFLRPGDVINIQDADDGIRIEFSGRAKSGSNDSLILLDRPVDLAVGEEYNLYVTVEEPAAYLQQDSATINSVTYSRGDKLDISYLQGLATSNGVTLKEATAALDDDFSNSVITSFSPHTSLEKRSIITLPGSNHTSIEVDTPFSRSIPSDSIWAISNVNEYQRAGQDAVTPYRILSVSEDKGEFAFVAGKYKKEKYDELEKNWAKYVKPYTPSYDESDFIPAPTNIGIDIARSVGGTSPIDYDNISLPTITIFWDTPRYEHTDSTGLTTNSVKFPKITSYEVAYSKDGGELVSAIVPSSATNYTFQNSGGVYAARVRAYSSTGKVSSWNQITKAVFIMESSVGVPTGIYGVPYGNLISAAPSFDTSKGYLTFPSSFTYYNRVNGRYSVAGGTLAQVLVDFDSLTEGETVYLGHDFSDLDNPWKVLQGYTDTNSIPEYTYLVNYDTFSPATKGLIKGSGTISTTRYDNTVEGIGTQFLSEFKAGELIRLSDNSTFTENSNATYATIEFIQSDTLMQISKNAREDLGSGYIYKLEADLDRTNDSLLCSVTKEHDSTGPGDEDLYSIDYFISSGADTPKAVRLYSDKYFIAYDEAGSESDTITLTSTVTGFLNPRYEWVVNDVVLVEKDNVLPDPTVFELPDEEEPLPGEAVNVVLNVYGIRDDVILATDNITIAGLQKGSSAITGFLTNQAHVVVADSSGTVTAGGYDDAGGYFKVYLGTDDITAECSFAIDPVYAGSITGSIVNNSVNPNHGRYSITAMSEPADVIQFIATIPAAYLGTATDYEINLTYSLTKAIAGADSSSRTVTLTSDKQVFVYEGSGDIIGTQTATFTATGSNILGAGVITYRFLVNGLQVQAPSADNTYVYSAPLDYDDTPEVVQVDMYEDGVLANSDQLSTYGARRGSNAISVVLSNESHTFPSDALGNVTSYVNSDTSIKVWQGPEPLTYDGSVTPANGTFKVTYVPDNIVVNTVSYPDAETVKFDNYSGFPDAQNVAEIDFTVTVTDLAGDTYTIPKSQSLTKAYEGQVGATGNAGRSVSLDATDQSIIYRDDGTSPDPSSITLTATPYNHIGTPYYEFLVNNSVVQAFSTTDTYSYSVPSLIGGLPATIEVRLREGASGGNPVVASDTLTIYGIRDVKSGFTLICTNESHAIPVTYDDNVISYANSGAELELYRGSEKLQLTSNASPSNGQWTVTNIITSNISAGLSRGDLTYNTTTDVVTIPDHTNLVGSAAYVEYEITFKDEHGVSTVITRKQTINRSRYGKDGEKTTIIRQYRWLLSTSAVPSSTSAASTYTWATGEFTNTSSNWTKNPGAIPGSGYTLYQAELVLVEESAAAPTTAFNWSNSGVSVSAIGATGEDGNPTNQSATVRAYKWTSGGTPSVPSTSAIYAWSSGNIDVYPSGWYKNPESDPLSGIEGYTLWAVDKYITDGSDEISTTFNWTTGESVFKVGRIGTNGTNGTNGSDGIAGRAIGVSPTFTAVLFNSSGNPTSSTTLAVTTEADNFQGTPFFQYMLEGAQTQNSSSATDVFNLSSSDYDDYPLTVEVRARDGASTGTIVARETFSIVASKAGANGSNGADGQDGADAIQILMKNPAQALPANASGTVTSYVGSDNEIRVIRGNSYLDNSTNSSYTNNNSWRVTSVNGVGITADTTPSYFSDGVSKYASFSNASNFVSGTGSSQVTAYIEYTIQYRDGNGVATGYVVRQNFSKSIAGLPGANGSNGADGADGAAEISRIAYASHIDTTITSGTVTTTGSSSYPPANIGGSNDSLGRWGMNTTWYGTPAGTGSHPSLSIGSVEYITYGVYNPNTNVTTWTTPYRTYLRVSQLDAITINTGALTINDNLKIGNLTVNGSGDRTGGSGIILGPQGITAGNTSEGETFRVTSGGVLKAKKILQYTSGGNAIPVIDSTHMYAESATATFGPYYFSVAPAQIPTGTNWSTIGSEINATAAALYSNDPLLFEQSPATIIVRFTVANTVTNGRRFHWRLLVSENSGGGGYTRAIYPNSYYIDPTSSSALVMENDCRVDFIYTANLWLSTLDKYMKLQVALDHSNSTTTSLDISMATIEFSARKR